MYKSEKQQAMAVILEIVRQSPGDAIETTVRLFKAFYFAHLYYATAESRYLTEWPIVRMPNGPGIDRFRELLDELVHAGVIDIEKIKVGPYDATKYHATGTPLEGVTLTEAELVAIRKAVEFVNDKTGAQLSDITHEFSRSWNTSRDGDELNIYADLLADEDFAAAQSAADRVRQDVASVFAS